MIRKATKEDASRLAEIQIYAKRYSYRSIFQNDEVSFNEMQVIKLALFYLSHPGSIDNIYVFDDGIVIGMMQWNCESSERWELKELYVDPFFQGEGIGTSLIKNIIESAKRRNAYETFLWVLEENPSAISFYERQGYMNTLTVLPIHTLASQ